MRKKKRWPRTIRFASGGTMIAVREVKLKGYVFVVESADGCLAHCPLGQNWYRIHVKEKP